MTQDLSENKKVSGTSQHESSLFSASQSLAQRVFFLFFSAVVFHRYSKEKNKKKKEKENFWQNQRSSNDLQQATKHSEYLQQSDMLMRM